MHGLVIQLKNVDFMQKMSCSLPSLEAIHAPRFMRGFMQNTVMRQASCVMQITHTRLKLHLSPCCCWQTCMT